MDLKVEQINDWDNRGFSKTDLSQKYGVSRPTVYKWLKRYHQFGIEGLKERSRAPKICPHRTPENIRSLVIQEKLRNRKRGPRKIRVQLRRQHPELKWPAISTISYWLKKEGLVERRKKRSHVPSYAQPFCECRAPNDVWSMDYKGQFYMKNGRVCYPLTLTDNFSRFILGCKAPEGPRYIPTRRCLELILREYGLPDAIRSDNGTPFAYRGTGGLKPFIHLVYPAGDYPRTNRKRLPPAKRTT
jgi:hypothetical protein